MGARDWFEGIRPYAVEIAKLESEIEGVETQAGPHGQSAGSMGGSANPDMMRGIDRLVDSGARERLARLKARIEPEIEAALDVLYGRSGRGGLAKAKASVDADILCCYYLQGDDWPRIAQGLSQAGRSSPNVWCRMRAKRALAYIDRVGADTLADS